MRERGSALPFAVAAIGMLLMVGSALGVCGSLFARHRGAQSAADLGALAGATALQQGGDPCQEASDIAAANQAVMIACDVNGQDVVVAVRVDGPRWLGQRGDLTAQARAGPRP